MARLELSIKYNSSRARLALYALAVLLPSYVLPVLAGFVGVAALALYAVYYALAGGGHFSLELIPFLLAALMLLSVLLIPAAIMLAYAADDRIVADQDGLTLPLAMMPELGWRKQVPWVDLTEIRALTLAAAGGDGQSGDVVDSVVIYFASGGFVRLKVSGFAPADLERFLLALESNAKGCSYTDDYLQMVESFKLPEIRQDQRSFTQIWESELKAGFQPALFEPLKPSEKLNRGRIRILRKLSFSGTFAQYLAILNGVQLVMVKECVGMSRRDRADNAKIHAEFDKEARTLLTLDHPQIVQVMDHFRDRGRNYLVLECFAAAQNFRQLVNQYGPQPSDRVVRWSKEIALVLDYLHSQSPQIIHGDLSPESLSPREDGKVMLVDLGWAEALGGGSGGWHKNRIPYKAPEQYQEAPGQASDVYAVGCIMHFLLTGWHPQPLRASHPSAIVSTVSSEIDRLIASCTAQDSAKRPQTAGKLFQQLNELSSDRRND